MIHLFFYINFVKNHRKLQNVKVKKPNVNEMIIYLERGIRIMKTWNDYKKHVNAVDPEISKDLKKTEEIATIVSAMIKQRNSLGLSQRDLASMCGLPQSSVARIDLIASIILDNSPPDATFTNGLTDSPGLVEISFNISV